MKYPLFFLSLFLLDSFVLSAQIPGGGMPAGRNMPGIARVFGKVKTNDTKEAVGYATVVLLPLRSDSVVSGSLTKDNGDFSLENLHFGQYRLKINYLGYQTLVKQITVPLQNSDQDLGNFFLEPEANTLKEVTVTAEKDRVQMAIDRKVFNVEKDIAAQNGTAADALKNVPTITVDNDGNAQLRGGSPQIFVDGKPTNLNLNQIPAAEIERVEVITNASAKYDANTTGGIVNIVMKKNTKPGINGMTNLGVGTNGRYNGMANLNIKQNPFNLGLSYNLNRARNINEGFTDRTNLGENGEITDYFRQDNKNLQKNLFQFGRAALDWNVDNRNVLTLSQMLMGGNFSFDDPQIFSFSDANRNILSSGERSSLGENQFRHYTTELGWRRSFPTPDKTWATSFQYNWSRGKNDLDLRNRFFDATGAEIPANPAQQLNEGGNRGRMLIFQTDFTQPLANGDKLEFGAKSQWKHSENDLDASLFDSESQTWSISDYLSTHYNYDDLVNAAYANYAGKFNDSWRYQAGLRFEQSWFRGQEEGSDSTFTYSYPGGFNNLQKALFPALYLSKKISESSEMQVNFSRKLNRPNFFQIMPFIMIMDNQSYRSGNPNLQPEFVNTAEWNYSKTFGRGSWLGSVYGKYTEQPITEITRPAEDGTTALLTTFINGSSSTAAGMENTLKIKLFKGFEATSNVNLFYQKISAAAVSNEGWNWMGKLNLDYKFAKSWNVQVSGLYESPRVIPQGTRRENYFADFAIRRDLGPMSSLSLTVSDIFNTKRMGAYTETDYFVQDVQRRRESRYISLGLSMRFGKPDFSLFKKQQQRKPGDSGAQPGGDMGY